MTVCYFGSYDLEYSRNRVLIDGLQKNGVHVIQCQEQIRTFLLRYPKLAWKFLRKGRKVDVIIVGFRGHEDMPLAWLLGKIFQKPVVFDMFISLYDTYLNDREIVQSRSIRAHMFYWIDKLGCLLADRILLDTRAHIDYLTRLLGLSRKKFSWIYVGGDDSLFRPQRKRRWKEVVVEFHGHASKLQGGDVVLTAKKKLWGKRNIRFQLVGESVESKTLPLGKLAALVAASDITIGHMGTTAKARAVISNKTFHGLASGNAVIVQDGPAARELLRDQKNALFVRAGDADDLVKKILFLVDYPTKRLAIARAGHDLFRRKLTNAMLGREFLKILSPVV